jgi:DNA-binding SARP family transcriptional activator
MRLLAWDGQISAALAQYEQCRHLLAEESGVESGKRTDGDTAVHTDAIQHPQLRY